MSQIKILFVCLLLGNTYFQTAERITLYRPLTNEEIEAYNRAHPDTPYTTNIVMPETLYVKPIVTPSGKHDERQNKLKNDEQLYNQNSNQRKIETSAQTLQKAGRGMRDRLKAGQIPYLQEALQNAVKTNNFKKTKRIIKDGADVNYEYANLNGTATSLLHMTYDPRMLTLLLEHGANPRFHGSSALLAHVNNPTNLQLLIQHGGDVNITDSNKSPLLFSALNGPLESLRVLLDAGANPNATDSNNNTAFDYLKYYDQTIFVITLLPKNEEIISAYQDLISYGGIVPELLKTDPLIKEANRRAIPAKIAKAQQRKNLATKFTQDLEGIIEEYL
ncbi:hypothetical protein KAZ82_01515 [Candidatus Babeliales bacterium]|nr:hypothetical protein [Candidatus Babeliales bacterium]